MTNIEAGWKTTFWGGRAQFNASIYQVKWEDAQTGLFAPELGFPNLQSFLNGPEYEVNGIEFNVVVAPMDGLTITAAGSYNKGELKNSPQVISNNPDSPTFGQPVTESCLDYDATAGVCNNVVSVQNLFGTPGNGDGQLAEVAVQYPRTVRVGMGRIQPVRRCGPAVPGRVVLVGDGGQSVRAALLDHAWTRRSA